MGYILANLPIFVAPALLIFFINVCMKHKKPVKAALVNMILGCVGLLIASYLLKGFGVFLMVNVFTVFTALSLGLPGVFMLAFFILA
ncbi:MAG: pro-sigmaK processing inhibitor BofA family protein [Oscillospiraceae bacterium]|nr:pro-sigmaK processing inhibitor BofA family protein [Oscillospiraceae bacterium]